MVAKASAKPLLLAITGPTASGKTDLAIRLAAHLPIELINMDSAQIYQDMDIGTGKISSAEQIAYPHHLMSIISPQDNYSVAAFTRDVHTLVSPINARQKIPLVVGGTMLYYRAIATGQLAKLPPADAALRQTLKTIIAEQGHEALKKELAAIDPLLSKQVQGNDSQRLIRFVEIARLTGKAPSTLFKAQPATLAYRLFHIRLFPEDRIRLYRRIEKRFDQMLKDGFIAEVEYLQKNYQLNLEHPSMRCAGYRQIWQYLAGDFDKLRPGKSNKIGNEPYQEMRDRSIFATRQLAKRQLTWLRKTDADITLGDGGDHDIQGLIKVLQTLVEQDQAIRVSAPN